MACPSAPSALQSSSSVSLGTATFTSCFSVLFSPCSGTFTSWNVIFTHINTNSVSLVTQEASVYTDLHPPQPLLHIHPEGFGSICERCCFILWWDCQSLHSLHGNKNWLKRSMLKCHIFKSDVVNQDSSNLVLKGRCPAEFRSNFRQNSCLKASSIPIKTMAF